MTFHQMKKALKGAVKGKAVKLYRKVMVWDENERPKHERAWLMGLEGRLTPARKEQLDGNAFLRAHGQPMHWQDPRTFSEKIMWGLLHYQNPLLVRTGDKFALKSYVDGVLGPGHVARVYDWWTDPADIDFDGLPDRFALKVNWGHGGYDSYVFVADKSRIDRAEMKRKLDILLAPSYNVHYRSFRWDAQFECPVIFAEEYLLDAAGRRPREYKLDCCHGRCQDVYVIDHDAEKSRAARFDRDFAPLPLLKKDAPAPTAMARPAQFDGILAMAEKLAAPFPYMRVDIYEAGDRVLVGEMTFANGSGLTPVSPASADLALGSAMDMPEYVNFDRLRESDPLPPAQAYLLDGQIPPEMTRRYVERKALTALFYYPDLEDPQTLNEKLLWTALHWDGPLANTLADRYETKRYIARTVGEQYVVPDVGVYTDTAQIDWTALPERFAAHATAGRGAGYHYLVRHKSCDSEAVFRATAGDWLIPWNTFYHQNGCLPGRRVQPRILIEALAGRQRRQDEYRFYCVHGTVKLACAVREQATERESHTYVDPATWTVYPVRLWGKHRRPAAPRPEHLEEMERLCRALTAELPLARVDFFEADGRVYVHDVTLDGALYQRLEPVEQDRALGDALGNAE